MSDGFFVLIMVLRCLILSPCLHAVMSVTQCLPVASIPEELPVTAVRNDVVDVRRLHVPSFLHALYAQRVHLQVLLSGLAPSSSVTSSGSAPHFLWVHGFVAITVLLP